MVTAFYEYFIYVCEYVLYTVYHKEGSNEAVFILPQIDKNLFQKAKLFKMKSIPEIQDEKVFKLAYVSLFGMKTFVIDMYAFAAGINSLYKLTKQVSPETFLSKLVKIQEKEKKEPAIDYHREKYKEVLTNF